MVLDAQVHIHKFDINIIDCPDSNPIIYYFQMNVIDTYFFTTLTLKIMTKMQLLIQTLFAYRKMLVYYEGKDLEL